MCGNPNLCHFAYYPISRGDYSIEEASKLFGEETSIFLRGLKKSNEFGDKKAAVESENYIKFTFRWQKTYE
jgi:GTP pyrophosphokinase